MKNLDAKALNSLLHSVFGLRSKEKALAIMVDLPSEKQPDSEAWTDRRRIAAEWYRSLYAIRRSLPFESLLFYTYDNVGSNNNDLPNFLTRFASPEALEEVVGEKLPLRDAIDESGVVIAMTEFSATAPLKILAREFQFRGATMPGFSRKMLPALALDYAQIDRRVRHLKEMMDRSVSIRINLRAAGVAYEAVFDTRFREGHASGGIMRNVGEVGNLPSGEAYIVPYEGERPGERSLSEGLLPVQFGNEIVVYQIRENSAVEVLTKGTRSNEEAALLQREPAYGNIAEVGIGVLGQWGVTAIGSTLLDEKLGLHVAFGRSDHFGGITSPSSFIDPANVIHIDRVYVHSVQPKISVQEVVFRYPDSEETVLFDDKLVVETSIP